ncbi:hypothetical protein [Spirosoma luteolum]
MQKTIVMKYFHFLGIALTLFVSLFLSGCEDHRLTSPTPARFRLASYSFRQNRFFSNAAFTYGPTGQVTSYTENVYNTKYNSTLTYNEKGQLIRIDRLPAEVSLSIASSYFVYEYNQAGNLIKRTKYQTKDISNSPNTPYSVNQVVTFNYDGTAPYPSRISQTQYQEIGTVVDLAQTDLTYQDGNVVRSVTTYPTSSNLTPSVNTYQFDDKPNPFYNFIVLPDGLGAYPYNRNNITSSVSILTYNSNGLITRSIDNKNTDPAFQAVSDYTYEQY